jgi:hypothetical protein
MKIQVRKGVSFGLTSGVITTLGLIVGLHSGTHSKIAVISGIPTIAIADAMSDALGMLYQRNLRQSILQKKYGNPHFLLSCPNLSSR